MFGEERWSSQPKTGMQQGSIKDKFNRINFIGLYVPTSPHLLSIHWYADTSGRSTKQIFIYTLQAWVDRIISQQ